MMTPNASAYATLHGSLVTQWNLEGPDAVWSTLQDMDFRVVQNLLMLQIGASAVRRG